MKFLNSFFSSSDYFIFGLDFFLTFQNLFSFYAAAQIHRQSATTVNYRLRIVIYQEGLYFAFASIHFIYI